MNTALLLAAAVTAIPWMVVIGLAVYFQRERKTEPADDQESRIQRWEKDLLGQIEGWREGR